MQSGNGAWSRAILGFGLALGSCFNARPAGAWGQLGHKVVALIAQDHLLPGALAQIDDILGKSDWGRQVGLEDIANCADIVRQNAVSCAHAFALPAQPESAGWHFIDIPVTDSPEESSLEKYCSGAGEIRGDCIIDQVKAQLAVLSSGASQADKQKALMFVVHFLGDIHQPMHCVQGLNDDGTPDRGGNDKPVQFKDWTSKANLHALWDHIIQTPNEEKAVDPRALANQIEGTITPADTANKNDDPEEMSLESFEIAKDKIYPEYDQDHGVGLGQAYQDAMRPIAYERLKKAGLRLADMLNAAFAAAQPMAQ